ncbi:cold-inducible RNA-binding protein B-like isoform X2 [Lineus longissimus]|uniref:cold-inducible RNA-binding protein B-like isoform X2 n=1 Tax=Lineus longissimus TaxID=88925 RepID=UPI002B4E51D0
MPAKIFVGNLVENADENALRAMFAEYGNVGECVVFHKYGFVHMATEAEANCAIDNLNQAMFQGQTMNVELSKSKPKREGSNYGKQQGDRGGGGRGGRGGRDGGPVRGRGGRSAPYGRDRDSDRGGRDAYSRDRDYPPPPDYYRRGGYGDFPAPDDRDRDPRSYWPPPDVYFKWFYDTYYPRGESARDPLDRPPPEYYRRDRGRDLPPYGAAESERERAYPFPRPDKAGYGAKDVAASLAGYPAMGDRAKYAYTTTNSSAYTGANYSSFGK